MPYGNKCHGYDYRIGKCHPLSMKKQTEYTERIKCEKEKDEGHEQPTDQEVGGPEYLAALSSDNEIAANADEDQIENARNDGHSGNFDRVHAVSIAADIAGAAGTAAPNGRRIT